MNTLKSHLRSLVVLSLLLVVFGFACKPRFHQEPTEEKLGTYRVSVRPSCGSSSTHSLDDVEKDGRTRIASYVFRCGDTTISIRGNALTVNGKPYGTLNRGDWIAVDFGKVRVNSEVRAEVR